MVPTSKMGREGKDRRGARGMGKVWEGPAAGGNYLQGLRGIDAPA